MVSSCQEDGKGSAGQVHTVGRLASCLFVLMWSWWSLGMGSFGLPYSMVASRHLGCSMTADGFQRECSNKLWCFV